jgi:TRAP transporter TAXI family solute receptor
VLQLVVAKGRGVKSLADLKRRTVAIDADGTAAHSAALAVLAAANISSKSLKLTNADPERAAELLAARRIDAFFVLAPLPSPVITRLAAQIPIELVSLPAGTIKRLDQTIYTSELIAASTYNGVAAVPTVSVGMLWIVTAGADEALIRQLTAVLWHDANTSFFTRQGLDGRNFANAQVGLSLPLHPGAERYYRERGVRGAAARDTRANLVPARAPNR